MPRVLGPKYLHLSVEPRERVTSQGSLRDSPCKGQHRQAAVFQLGKTHPLLALLVAREPVGQAVIAGDLKGVPFEDLLGAAELHDGNPEEDLGIHSRRTTEGLVRIDAHRHRFEGELLTREANEVGHHQSQPSQHCDATMLQLRLAKVGHHLRLRREAEGVELKTSPRALGSHETLGELSVVEEVDAGVLIGNCQLTPPSLLCHLRLSAERGAHGQGGQGCGR
mmetsp:Transcript_118707/g.166883  ORF Transcript_118707/g.166883 Transcript_118707/m.166883 type:complete len:223 (-) Transcript_118707:204-872(-)